MSTTILARAVLVTGLALALVATASAQSAAPIKFTGVINDYSDTTNAAGAWHLTGEWSVKLDGKTGRGSFAGGLTMVRATSGVSPHTHHVTIVDGSVTELPNGTGFTITGLADITLNGAVFFAGAPVTVELTGSSDVLPSNIKILFGGSATGHFGAAPIDGVVSVTK
jgi:hypothetical protein